MAATVNTNIQSLNAQRNLNSSEGVVINQGQAVIGFASTSYEASGQLEGQNVLSVDAANETILAVDSALTAVSSLRSTFGAKQAGTAMVAQANQLSQGVLALLR